VRSETAPEGFDIIIDDCSHIGEFTAVSFWHLFDRHLKPGGLYVIEDWGTGYMRGTPDGRACVPPGRSHRSVPGSVQLSKVSLPGLPWSAGPC